MTFHRVLALIALILALASLFPVAPLFPYLAIAVVLLCVVHLR